MPCHFFNAHISNEYFAIFIALNVRTYPHLYYLLFKQRGGVKSKSCPRTPYNTYCSLTQTYIYVLSSLTPQMIFNLLPNCYNIVGFN